MDFLSILPPQRHCTSELCDNDESVQAIISALEYTGLAKILTETFSADEFVEALDARLLYIAHIILSCKETNVPINTDTFLCPLAERIKVDVDDLNAGSLKCMKVLLHHCTNRYFIKIVEKMTRGQSSNLLWFLVRNELVTGSSVVKQCSYKPGLNSVAHGIFRPASRFEVFGKVHEPIVRDVIATFVERRPIPVSETLGLLIDPFSGTFGASIDLCYGIEEHDDGFITVGERAHVYEIKCMARYIYSAADVEGFLDNPTLKGFASLIKGATFPLIEHRLPGATPSSGAHIVSHDRMFETNRKRKSIYESNDHVRRLLNLNRGVKSTVYIFREKSQPNERDKLTLECLATFTANIFLNARHKYFDQTSMQYFVVTQHYINDHPDPECIEPDTLPRVSVVTALFKTRTIGTHHSLEVNRKTYPNSAIPFALIVTPVAFDAEILSVFLRETFDNYAQQVYNKSKIRLWDPNFLRGFVASHRELEKTP
ncbi:alkaline exonuclease [Elephant endotheliotropic herpesvirus 1A]|uniref:Alkaline exonuclease n=2 Tax=Elephantid herpesvirus 1 TaxID=146015 RepID=E2IKY2_ELHV1|nr:U70 [Elephant endotheliotropic herpesvirus 1A]WES72522.1 alkaline exonuclease [Elephantid betaherpesvirus 1]AGG16106.1 alkaline exonuclease [Elephant endotheliotropic herpesvirus 1A]QOE74615.1 alkaline exonuclease [Elephant endotheliotropic herpesvirus 1A]QOE74732.1 alkaline exonuclease [Elephant endotheliotropic herpesvirus 1A]